jgi:hypothetical protein
VHKEWRVQQLSEQGAHLPSLLLPPLILHSLFLKMEGDSGAYPLILGR